MVRPGPVTDRLQQGLSAYAWSDGTRSPRVTRIRAAHVVELRAALDEVYTAAARPSPAYTDPSLTVGSTTVKAVHLAEIRSAVAVW